jgi:hypothetical protein
MGATVNGLGSFDPSTLLDSLTGPAASAPSTGLTNGVTAQQEFSAMQQSGDLSSLLSDSVAVGVLQFANPATTPSSTGTDFSTMISQLIAAYTPVAAASSVSGNTPAPSAATLSTNPALAIIQELEQTGVLSSTMSDAVGASTLSPTLA